jgi:murein DD-endopeptidase MepM/ murein hydrolase activator NlpD
MRRRAPVGTLTSMPIALATPVAAPLAAPVAAPVAVAAAALLTAGTLAVVASPRAPTPPPPPAVALHAGSATERARGRAVRSPADMPTAAVGPFRWPLNPVPRVLRGFVVGPYQWSPGHRGVDLAAAGGEHVLAAGPGIVTFAGPVAGRGVVVVAHADGLRTTYEPVAPGVRVGERIVAGTPIGTLTAGPGHCPGPCLHWGALRREVYVDPLSLLGPPALPVLLPDVGTG